jgi:hypothetical protein
MKTSTTPVNPLRIRAVESDNPLTADQIVNSDGLDRYDPVNTLQDDGNTTERERVSADHLSCSGQDLSRAELHYQAALCAFLQSQNLPTLKDRPDAARVADALIHRAADITRNSLEPLLDMLADALAEELSAIVLRRLNISLPDVHGR